MGCEPHSAFSRARVFVVLVFSILMPPRKPAKDGEKEAASIGEVVRDEESMKTLQRFLGREKEASDGSKAGTLPVFQ